MPVVDRQTTTPFLIRIFSSHGKFHRIDEFNTNTQPSAELNLYSWKDATLGELTTLLAKELIGETDRRISSFKFSFRLVYGDNTRGKYLIRDIGTVQPSQDSRDAQKSLGDARFVIGDWVDIAILQPGDRLYDQRNDDRDSRGASGGNRGLQRGGRGGFGTNTRGGYASRGQYSNGSSYRPYEREDRHRRSPDGRWSNDGYRRR
jgi:histone deacetylase complex subunit SAP18